MENKNLLFGLILLLGTLTGAIISSLDAQAAITLLGPVNYTAWSSQNFVNQKFAFSIDNATGIDANCTLFFTPSNVVNTTSNDLTSAKFSFSNMTAINLTVNNGNTTGDYALGQHYWNISCVNNSEVGAGVVTTTSVTWIFQYDTVAPLGNITLPINKSYVNTAPTVFNGTLNDSWSGIDTSSVGIQLRNSSGGSENCFIWLNRTWGGCNANPAGQTTPDWTAVNYTLVVNSSNFNSTLSTGKNLIYLFATLVDDKYDFRLYTKDNVTIGSPSVLSLNSTFTLDTTLPGTAIFSVNGLTNNSWINSRALRINITATDSYLNYFNITINATNSSNISSLSIGANDTLYNVSVGSDATYTINLTAIDNATNTNSSPSFYVRVDATIPNSTIFSVGGSANNSWFNTRILVINVTAADVNINYFNLTINATNSTNISTGGVYDTVYNLSVGSDSRYIINLTTVDNASNINSTAFYVYVDTAVPNATLFNVNSVTNNSWFNTRVLMVNVSALDLNIKYFNVTINATNSTNITTGGVTETLHNLSVGSDGTYTINLTVADNATNSNSSAAFYVRVDATVPNSTILSVNGRTNNSWTNTRIWVINVTAADVNIDYFNITINVTNSTNISTGGVYNTSYNLSVSGNEGIYRINLTAVDNASNINSSPAFYLGLDLTIPGTAIFSVNGLTNNSWINSRALRINITATDSYLNYFNITINATNSSNISSLSIGANDTLYNVSVGSDATYKINLTAVDNATNTNSSNDFYVRVDATVPTAVINNISGKINNSWTTSRQLQINFTASDANIKNWSIFVYNSTDIFNNSLSGWNLTYYESNTSAVYNFTASQDGTYTVNLTIVDNATNANTTSLFYIKVDTTNPSIGTPTFSGISSSGATISVEMGETNLNSCTYSGSTAGTLSCSGGTCTASISGLSASTIGSYSVACTDLAGNSATGATNSFTTSSASSGSGSGGSGGGSGSSVAGQFSKKVWSSLYAGELATVKVAEGDGIGATEVSFKVDKTSYGVIADVKKVDKTEVSAELSGKKVHNYLKIAVTGAIKAENIQEGKIIFKVAKKWLVDNVVSKDKLALYRYADSKWNALPTKITQEDDTTVYYSAETPGFSYFAIAESDIAVEAPSKEELPVEEAPLVEEPETSAKETPATEAEVPAIKEKSKTWLWIVLVVVIAGIIAAIYFWPKKNKRGF